MTMRKPILVADSGGTQTDWCFVDENGERHYFLTKSYHPSNWNEKFLDEQESYWSLNPRYKTATVYFYGAGCLKETNKKKIANYFKQWGFSQVQIYSDVEGAYLALNGTKEGTIAILGTGSVVCHYDTKCGFSIDGGFGYLLGDEGSGYYFGKLLLNKLLNQEIASDIAIKLNEILGNRNEILEKVYSAYGKDFISSIASLTKGLPELLPLHRENLHLFISKYLIGKVKNKSISIVGSYGFHFQSIFDEILKSNNLKLEKSIQFPINHLTDYIEKLTF